MKNLDNDFEKKLRTEIIDYTNRIERCSHLIREYSNDINLSHYEILMRRRFLNETETTIEPGSR